MDLSPTMRGGLRKKYLTFSRDITQRNEGKGGVWKGWIGTLLMVRDAVLPSIVLLCTKYNTLLQYMSLFYVLFGLLTYFAQKVFCFCLCCASSKF